MTVKYTQRFVTGDFAYAEIEADTFEEFVEAAANLGDHLGGEAVAGAVETVKKAFGKTTTVSSGKSGFGNKSQQQSNNDTVELGEHDGYKVTLRQGKFGWYFNAYQRGADPERINANLPKGKDPAKATLEDAIEALSEAA